MTPERAAALAAWWVRVYTRNLPEAVASRRREELDADLHDQIAHERAHGAGDLRIALGILSRMVRGIAADASWRARHAATAPGAAARRRSLRRSVVRVALATASILMLPLVAMQLTDEVVWTAADFAAAGALLFGAGLAFALAARRARHAAYRSAAGIAIAAVLALVWAAAAVGVVAEDGDRADLMYGAVLAVGLAGTVLARCRAQGMARTLLAMAFAQALVAAIALIAGAHDAPGSSAVEVAAVNGVFVALFAGSAVLFRAAAHRPASRGAGPGSR